MTGDHGREDAIELRDTLLLYVVEASGDWSSENRKVPAWDTRLGVDLTVPFRVPSSSTLVEIFHFGRLILSVWLILISPAPPRNGDESGVRLWLCLCPDLSGVKGEDSLLNRLNSDDRWRRVRVGSEEGVCSIIGSSFGTTGVAGTEETGDLAPLAIFRASLRNGEVAREMVDPPLDFPDCEPFGGDVVRKALFVWPTIPPDVLEIALSLGVTSSDKKIFRTDSMSLSVRAILSLRCCHL